MKHIAVIGSGIAGLSCAYVLSRRHRVTLFERDDRLGGHTHTVVVDGQSGPLALDTGFLVHNEPAYPHLVRLFAELRVCTQPTDMSFSVSCPSIGFEYSSRGLDGFFSQRQNLLRGAHYRLLSDILRFNRTAAEVLTMPAAETWTVDDYLRARGYGQSFCERYLAPMASAVWSAPLDSVYQFPAQTLVRFMHNHGMLTAGAHPPWRVVRGGSHAYIPRLVAPLRDAVHTGAHLVSVTRHAAGVRLDFANRPSEEVDEVVLACHGDQVLPLLADASDVERDVFQHFTTTANETWLHTDARFLPKSPRARASWNYHLGDPGTAPSITYDLNRLQGLGDATRYCVTLNPRMPLDPDRVIGRFAYRHPRVTRQSVRAQRRWPEVSGIRRTHYCGAYWGYGFHEDGLVSALRVARALGVQW